MLSIDPSSPFTQGALLGDRIRLTDHFLDPGVFIRSMANRGALGGLSEAALQAALLMDASGKDDVLLETVGVGQAEVDIIDHADTVVLVLMPGSGDSIQALKAGIMEIPDIIVVNKADHPLTDTMVREIRGVLSLAPQRGWRVPIIKTEAVRGKGVEELDGKLDEHRAHIVAEGTLSERRRRNLRNEVLALCTTRLRRRLEAVSRRTRASRRCSTRSSRAGSTRPGGRRDPRAHPVARARRASAARRPAGPLGAAPGQRPAAAARRRRRRRRVRPRGPTRWPRPSARPAPRPDRGTRRSAHAHSAPPRRRHAQQRRARAATGRPAPAPRNATDDACAAHAASRKPAVTSTSTYCGSALTSRSRCARQSSHAATGTRSANGAQRSRPASRSSHRPTSRGQRARWSPEPWAPVGGSSGPSDRVGRQAAVQARR